MSIKSFILLQVARYLKSRVQRSAASAISDQQQILINLVAKAKKTGFGKDHHFDSIHTYEDFTRNVPVRDYEGLKPYFDRIVRGEKNVLWPGKPKYLAKTSGTTSGVKYIPVSHDSVPNHIHSARDAIFYYMAQKGSASIFDGKMIFLSGSPELESKGGIPTGRLSGIVNHEVPAWIRTNQLPSWKTNCIEDWEQKLDAVIDETLHHDMRVIGGIPPWVQMYFEKILQRTGKTKLIDVFPNFSLFIYGGVNFEPYRASLEKLIGKKVDSIEYFPASEGFFAFHTEAEDGSLLLTTNSGIFYEFIPLTEFGHANAHRLPLWKVETGVDYALIVNNNAGLFGYDIGDAVRFTSIQPYKLVVTGRVKHYISAFGEHVIGKEVEEAMHLTVAKHGAEVNEFTVAPQVNPPEGGLAYHEWLIEFEKLPPDPISFAADLDKAMTEQNIYYKDLIDGNVLRPLVICVLPKGSFIEYMKKQGKLGGQNKVPRLMNERKIADALHSQNLAAS
jgi:hypothetical protein